MGKLTVAGVRSAKPGRHADGLGLYLLVKKSGARSWMLRVQVDKRRRDIGLGSVADLTLAEAREKAAVLRKVARQRRDPIAERDKDRRPTPTFAEAAKACHADLKSQWQPKQQDAFLSSLERHAFTALGKLRVDQVQAHHIRDLLAPIWTEIPGVARKLRQRVGTVLNYAKAKGWRESEAPGKSVTMGLAKQQMGTNHPAMPYIDVPSFVADLNARSATVGRLALQFTIFTAARSGETRKARWSHIDLEKKLWVRPAELMKMRTAHVVTLSDNAVEVLTRAAQLCTSTDNDFIFPSSSGLSLSDMTLSKIMRDAKLPYTVHGFRSSFRDWAAEQMPQIPDAVAEAALAHAVSDKVERAYKRAPFLEMRRELLDAWGAFVGKTKSRIAGSTWRAGHS
ncbi:MAG: integrase arm-type DNA-binding domain-containing protein [Sphingomonadaceae bacterium]|nr:integrase arm-type DNA-binding domain-containing protein [Sphingomonadaceae bacterium]